MNKCNRVLWTNEKVFELLPQNYKLAVRILPAEEIEDFPTSKVQLDGQRIMF